MRLLYSKRSPGGDLLPEMDGGIEQNPAYGTARILDLQVKLCYLLPLEARLTTILTCRFDQLLDVCLPLHGAGTVQHLLSE